MTYTDLEIGEYYHVAYGDRFSYIFRAHATHTSVDNLDLTNKNWHSCSGNMCSDSIQRRIYREATLQEIEHFLQCEKAKKYMEYKPEVINYEIC